MEELNYNLPACYRPNNFDELLGNEGVKRVLKAYQKNPNRPKSIMLSGPTGGGKTTTGRIYARTLNCSQLTEGFNPCGQCPSCQMPLQGCGSIIEVNCTMRRGLDDMRQLIRVSNLTPRQNFRILILDEIQGATSEAHNALLKPLEEPPALTYWILCTSEPNKVPKAIAGRCVQLALTYPPPAALQNRLREIARKDFGRDIARLLRPYLLDIIDQCDGQPRASIELMGVLGTALSVDKKALSNQLLAKQIVESFLDDL
ncbi:MAG: AAA family ATPase [Desulfobaccales bacterium]